MNEIDLRVWSEAGFHMLGQSFRDRRGGKTCTFVDGIRQGGDNAEKNSLV